MTILCVMLLIAPTFIDHQKNMFHCFYFQKVFLAFLKYPRFFAKLSLSFPEFFCLAFKPLSIPGFPPRAPTVYKIFLRLVPGFSHMADRLTFIQFERRIEENRKLEQGM